MGLSQDVRMIELLESINDRLREICEFAIPRAKDDYSGVQTGENDVSQRLPEVDANSGRPKRRTGPRPIKE